VTQLRNNRTSLRRNRITPQQQLPQTVVLQTPAPHKLDVWLPRIANFTQVALLALTAGGFYFTVLPLYQKALLDEAFARKEIELKQVTTTLDAQYAQLRQLAVREFVMRAEFDCSGLGETLRTALNNTSVKKSAFSVDVKQCLLRHETIAPNLSVLRANDRNFFRIAVTKVADRLVTLQSEAAAGYTRAEKDVNDSNTDAYAAKREFSARQLALLSPYMKPDEVTARKRQNAVAQLREERIQAYRSAVGEQLRGLNKMHWPTNQQ
jgi:hypothetical protein